MSLEYRDDTRSLDVANGRVCYREEWARLCGMESIDKLEGWRFSWRRAFGQRSLDDALGLGAPQIYSDSTYGFTVDMPCWLLATMLALSGLRSFRLRRFERKARQCATPAPYRMKFRFGLAIAGGLVLLLALNSVWSLHASGLYGELSVSGGILDFETSAEVSHKSIDCTFAEASAIRLRLPQFGTYGGFDGEPSRCTWVEVPIWFLIMLSMMYTADVWRRGRRFVPAGYCSHCGYNLTGNTTGICPECGVGTSATK